ncbi:hypothetical protein H4582DRAFT_1065436 [Lactarius indigo]|nr:hypothetical protein H4582DRAFT_1065436 [Lactarius indigo]
MDLKFLDSIRYGAKLLAKYRKYHAGQFDGRFYCRSITSVEYYRVPRTVTGISFSLAQNLLPLATSMEQSIAEPPFPHRITGDESSSPLPQASPRPSQRGGPDAVLAHNISRWRSPIGPPSSGPTRNFEIRETLETLNFLIAIHSSVDRYVRPVLMCERSRKRKKKKTGTFRWFRSPLARITRKTLRDPHRLRVGFYDTTLLCGPTVQRPRATA